MSRSRRLVVAVATLAAVGGALVLGGPTAQAATTQSASCVDGGGTRWNVRVVWGAVYSTSAGVAKAALDSAAWTTAASGPLATDARVRTYDGAGTLLQDLRSTPAPDYRSGTVFSSRNPVNPPSAPGLTRVSVTLGVDGDGFGDCSVTLTQPGSAGDRYEADVVTATNAERRAAGLLTVTPQACVDRFAEAQASRMAAEGRMAHQDLQPVLEACRLNRVGENVAYGYASGREVTAAWMASPGHRANLLTTHFRLIGVGAARDADGRWYSAQVLGTLAAR